MAAAKRGSLAHRSHSTRSRAVCRLLPLLLLALLVVPAAAHAGANQCQPYGATPCLFPFPDDRLTVRDESTDTGRRVSLPADAMPVTVSGQRMSPAEYDRNDGFSPGSEIIVHVPGLETQAAFDGSGIVPLADMSHAFDAEAPVVVIDAATHQRWPIWAELDAGATQPADVNLLIHPARNFLEGHRYVVALRGLRDAAGNPLTGPEWFRQLQAHHDSVPPALRHERRRYKHIFKDLRRAGISRDGLYEAWDFTVMSQRSLSARLLHIRNRAFARLGDGNLADGRTRGEAPSFTIDKVETAPDPRILRRVTGTITVPCYLDQAGCPPGSRFNYSSSSPDALPTQTPGNVDRTQFICNIPTAALTGPAHISLYGHGLLGSPSEINAGNVQDMSAEHNFMFCATRWQGLSDEDVPNAAATLQNLDRFPTVADRLQQGVLNMLYLGRLMLNPQGLASNPAFQQDGHSLIDTSRLFYDGNSQGGIQGGITTAVAPDFTRSALGVAGMNYGGLLLQRSVDFDQFLGIVRSAYPDESERPLLYELIQQLWDRGEADGYAQHMTGSALPDTPAHQVLLHIAFGDHQVTNYAADVEARTIGASAHCPALNAGRIPDQRLLFGIPCIGSYPFTGPGIVYWDTGPGNVGPPPLANVPNRSGSDPHSSPRATVAARTQKSTFLLSGQIVDVCGGQPCHTDNYAP
jgi:hypothetical protein